MAFSANDFFFWGSCLEKAELFPEAIMKYKMSISIDPNHKKSIAARDALRRTKRAPLIGQHHPQCIMPRWLTLKFEVSDFSYERVTSILQRYSIGADIKQYDGYIAITLIGLPNDVTKCKTELLHLPIDWVPQSKNCEMVPVEENSPEWFNVSDRVTSTLNITITAIERIQNLQLWANYNYEKNKLVKIGRAQELQLFHGTSETDPNEIYNGEYGFDICFSRNGLWGRGIYFAEDASYSADYAHKLDGGFQQFFLVNVCVGDSITRAPDSSIIVPPKQNSSSPLATKRYDSVHGVTAGTNVWIIYANSRAYPRWLITYKDI